MRTYATILILLLTVPAHALDTLQVTTPDPVTEAWRWTTFDRSSGLAGVPTEIFEDRDGYIWFATNAGVQRYDGWTFETFTKEDGLASSLVGSIAQTRDGAMWFGTGAGITRYDGQGWKTYTTEDSLASNSASTSGNNLFEARDGTLWAGFRGTGDVSRLVPGEETWETIATPLSDTTAMVTKIIQTSDGDLWFAAWNRGALRWDRSTQTWQHYSSRDVLGVDKLMEIVQVADGTILAGGFGGVARFDGARWRPFEIEEDGFGSHGIHNIWQSEDGSIRGFGNGFYRLEGDRWRRHPSVPGSRALPASDGSIWTWSGGGAYRFTPRDPTWTVFSDVPVAWAPENQASDNLFVLADEIWVGGGDGAARLEGDAWIKYTSEDGLFDGPVNTIVKATDGAIWFAGADEGGSVAARFDPRVQGERAWRRFTQEDGLAGGSLGTGLAVANGDVWFGTKASGASVGVVRYDGRDWTVYSLADGLLHGRIYRLAEGSNGHVWVGTFFGLNRFDGQVWTSHLTPDQGAGQFQKIRALSTTIDVWTGNGGPDGGAAIYDGQNWTRFTTDDGLPHDGVWAIYQSRDGTVWAGTPAGLSRYDETGWSSYAGENGPDSMRARSIAETADGAIWIRGWHPGSVIRHIPDHNPPETHILPAIDQVSSAGNILLQWSGGDYYNDTPTDRLRYQYRVDDGDWSRSTHLRTFTFTSLDDGDHRIEVRAVDWSGNIDPTPSVHAFIVEGPWWKNPYVAVSGFLMLGMIGLQTTRVVRRDSRLRQSNEALSAANNELFQVNVDLQREQVLDRLRGQAQGMQSSEDIKQVVEAVYRELTGLGLPLMTSAISIHSETGGELWAIGEDGRAQDPFTRELDLSRLRSDFHSHREGEEATQVIRNLIAGGNPRWKGVPEGRWPQQFEWYNVAFKGGHICMVSEEPIAEEHLMLIKRFGEVFGYTHSRYKELQEKEAQNRRLVVEASVQRLRAEVQSMDEASDFERILSLLTDSLKTVELTFDGCEIDVLDEPVENPKMAHFESNGFRYTTYTLDPNGRVGSESFPVPAPFPGIVRQTIERFIESEPWQGTSEGEAIVEVPAGSYGRLRLNDTERDSFTDDEVATLREFADAVALGYARYLDIREIQLNTERKSEFLASMSHELRTPMTAIKGFTNLVLGREKSLSDRGQENLQKVDQASDHLLAMINDLLDLSKIEAGHVDVNPERFDVGELVASACDTVSPLIQEGVKLRQDVADDIGEANTDKARLQQMVINLLSNAIKFTDSGGVTVSASQSDGQLVIAVTDTGKGIPADELPTIFDEYRQAEGSESSVQKGTGLGLSITKKFAELLGGTIGVESEVGKGSTFTVRVPVSYQDA